MNDSFGSAFRPKLRNTRGLKRDGKNTIRKSNQRPDFSDSKLRSRSPSEKPVKKEKPKTEPKGEDIDQKDIRKKIEAEVGDENDKLIISFCQNEEAAPGSSIKWELRETKTGERNKEFQKSETNVPIPEEKEEDPKEEKPKGERPKKKEKVKFDRSQKKQLEDFLKGKKKKEKSKYLLRDHVERVLLILGQRYILSYHDRIRREKEHEKLKKTIQKNTYENKLENLKNNFKESEENIQNLWESRLAQNKVTKFTTRVDFKFVDMNLKKIERIFNEKEFDLECIDKARYGKDSLQEKVETNRTFFKEFQEKFKKARLKVIDTNK